MSHPIYASCGVDYMMVVYPPLSMLQTHNQFALFNSLDIYFKYPFK